jgi:4-carboxymuconolactone decarboxylase
LTCASQTRIWNWAGVPMLSPSQAAMYRRLTLGDEALMTALFSTGGGPSAVLDDRTAALARLAALIAVDADTPAYQCEVRAAISAGASPEEITEVLVVVARVAGSALVMSAAPKLSLALGYDVDDGLEDASTREDER